MAQVCQENGSLWTPKMSVSIEKEPKTSIVVAFATAQYSERYQISIMNGDLLILSKNISKVESENNVTDCLGFSFAKDE